jgi:hypothetical protein
MDQVQHFDLILVVHHDQEQKEEEILEQELKLALESLSILMLL